LNYFCIFIESELHQIDPGITPHEDTYYPKDSRMCPIISLRNVLAMPSFLSYYR